jgi:predicted dienelactone hydrolase
MKRIGLIGIIGFGLFLLCACSSTTMTPPATTAIKPEASATILLDLITSTPPPTSTILPQDTQEPPSFSLSELGPYYTGFRNYTLVDESRDNRQIKLTIWYPALNQVDDDGKVIVFNAVPDLSGGPYPLILTSQNTGTYLFRSHLASYGFVMAIIGYPEDYDYWDFQMIDHPRDMVFVLDQIASNPPEGLEGIIDSDHVGVTGYSSDGDVSITLGGARVDPEFYLSQCEQAPLLQPAPPVQWVISICGLAKKWDEFTSHEGDEITTSDDGLWQPVTDERIRAVMPLSSGGAWLYGERGLAAIDRPIFIIGAYEDEIVPYQFEAAYIYNHIKIPEKYLVTFTNRSHMMVLNTEAAARMKHFATAFFGYYLQGREDYAKYISRDFVMQFVDLAWGIYKK